MIDLVLYRPEWEQEALALIQGFWLVHSQNQKSDDEAREDLLTWTEPGHHFYFIQKEGDQVGFLHLGSRGGACDWLEDLFVRPEYQNQGIGTEAIRLAEEMVRQYSDSMYVEAAARNQRALSLYRRLGFDCLNSVSVRKDFPGFSYDVLREETLAGQFFEVRTPKR